MARRFRTTASRLFANITRPKGRLVLKALVPLAALTAVLVPLTLRSHQDLQRATYAEDTLTELTAMFGVMTVMNAATAEASDISSAAAIGAPTAVTLGGPGSVELMSVISSELTALRHGTPSMRSLARQLSDVPIAEVLVPINPGSSDKIDPEIRFAPV